jgi:hypothetical protein
MTVLEDTFFSLHRGDMDLNVAGINARINAPLPAFQAPSSAR